MRVTDRCPATRVRQYYFVGCIKRYYSFHGTLGANEPRKETLAVEIHVRTGRRS